MKFAIVSDTHDHVPNFRKIIDWCNQQEIEVMLHCGDICRQATIDEAEKLFKGKIYWVKGNGDYGLEIPEKMELELGGKKIFFNHYPDVAKRAAETGKYDLSFYGHTHKPWLDLRSFSVGGEEKTCIIANPGEAAGQRYMPTFAVYDTEKDYLELKILDKL